MLNNKLQFMFVLVYAKKMSIYKEVGVLRAVFGPMFLRNLKMMVSQISDILLLVWELFIERTLNISSDIYKI